MEYSWSYAAARAPVPSTYHQKPKPRPDRPNRSNSTSGARPKRKPRIPGHSRASSCSSNNLPTHDIPLPLLPQELQGHDPAGGAGEGNSPAEHGHLPTLDPNQPHSHNNQQQPQQQQQHQHHQRRDRVAALVKYYQTKQLPATPRIDTETENATNTNESGPASAQTPASPRLARPLSFSYPLHTSTSASTSASATASAAATSHQDRRMFQHAAMFADPNPMSKISSAGAGPSTRADSVVSSNSGGTTLSSRTMLSSETPWNAESAAKPLIVRNGRTYISDPSLPYPLPVDLAELHRQSLRILMLFQLFGGPICSPEFANKPPTRVLEVGCGSGFWSMMCHRYYARHGHSDISFAGIDIAPIAAGAGGQGGNSGSRNNSNAGAREGNRASGASSSSPADARPDSDMRWRFVQHDMRKLPWPFASGEFDLIMVKDMSLATSSGLQQPFMDEYLRMLSPGGTLEIWESDHTIRMLRPHVPESRQQVRQPANQGQGGAGGTDGGGGGDSDSSDSEEDEQTAAASLGAYIMTGNTPLSAPLNNFLVEYNGWVSRALEARGLSAMPCTLIGPMLLQEAEILAGIGSRRLAVPLSEARWEREGVGGVVTKDGKSYIETKGKSRGPPAPKGARDAGRPLTAAQAALRRTALTTVVQQIQGLEGVLREASGKSQDEWDGWLGKMMNDLVKENGTSWGECLEVGAWWAKKKS